MPGVDGLDDVARLHAALGRGRARAGGRHHQEREAAREHQADVGVPFARRLLVGAQLVRIQVGAVPVQRIREADPGAGHGPVEVDRLHVGVQHQAHDLVEHGELAVGRVAQHAAQQRSDGHVADEKGGDEGDDEASAGTHG